ncbi:MAG: glycosyltransferase [Candidatus Levybacteria bacterium]|nr:glycosyltransferase [Candidatus Levybacteria bacterium]
MQDKNMKKATITIGIPAYNEELNIKFLLKSLLKQKVESADISEIIVISDGSTDRTVEIASSVRDERIKVIDQKARMGGRAVQNEIIKRAKGDILVMLDADVIPVGSNFVDEIIKPILHDKDVGLVGANIVSAKPDTFVEKVISASHELKWALYKRINNRDNIYLCHGRARAFSRGLYRKINWPQNAPEDAYSYLLCKKKGFKFIYASKAKVIFRSPANLADHFKQSNRFVKGKKEMEKYFPASFVKKQYRYSKLLLAQTVTEYLLKNPVAIIGYIAITVYVRIFGIKDWVNHAKWDISPSTKKIIYEK